MFDLTLLTKHLRWEKNYNAQVESQRGSMQRIGHRRNNHRERNIHDFYLPHNKNLMYVE